MNKKLLTGGLVAGLIAAMGAAGVVVAQSTGPAPSVTQEQAIEFALAEVPGTVQEVELEREDGTQVYEIEILTPEGVEMEVEIDAASGEIVEIEAEDDDEDDDDDHDDDNDDADGQDAGETADTTAG